MPLILLYALLIAVCQNLLFFVIAYVFQTDKLTDLTYSLTFIAIAITGYLFSDYTVAGLITLCLIVLWAVRLGMYLMARVHKMGRDDRFDKIRPYPIKFLGFWTVQAVTCFLVSLSALIIFSDATRSIDVFFIAGLVVALGGLLLEIIADYQKYDFKSQHPKRFMQTGVWRMVRHPNYTGEILFWLGLSIAAVGSPYWLYGFISPLWISFLLTKFSGVPILQKKWETNYGDQQAYQEYKANSYKLIPFIY